jgi:preprotein translocase subunit SecG
MAILLYILFVVICLILILVVLVQDEQGDSLGGIFGGGSTTPFGSRSGNVLTRITGVLAAAFFLVSLIVGLVNRSSERGAITEQAAADTARSRFFERRRNRTVVDITRHRFLSPDVSPVWRRPLQPSARVIA